MARRCPAYPLQQALEIQRDPESTAQVFTGMDENGKTESIDLWLDRSTSSDRTHEAVRAAVREMTAQAREAGWLAAENSRLREALESIAATPGLDNALRLKARAALAYIVDSAPR